MEENGCPEEIRAATAHFVKEAYDSLSQVLAYSHPRTSESDWPRMALYKLTDAEDLLGMLSGLIAAFLQGKGMSPERLHRYLQVSQQRSRAAGVRLEDRNYLAGLMGQAPIEGDDSHRYGSGKHFREYMEAPDLREEWVLASLYALGIYAPEAPEEFECLTPAITAKAQLLRETVGRADLERLADRAALIGTFEDAFGRQGAWPVRIQVAYGHLDALLTRLGRETYTVLINCAREALTRTEAPGLARRTFREYLDYALRDHGAHELGSEDEELEAAWAVMTGLESLLHGNELSDLIRAAVKTLDDCAEVAV